MTTQKFVNTEGASNVAVSNHEPPPDEAADARGTGGVPTPPASQEGGRPVRRILYIDHTARMSGGEIALLHLVQYLDRSRYEPVVVLSSDGPLREKLKASGIETHLLLAEPSVLETRKDSLGLSTLLRVRDLGRAIRHVLVLQRFIRTNRISLVHTNSLKSDIMGGAAARLARTPLLNFW